MRFNVAIDGPSAAGKSSIAKLVAKHYNLIHLDTGAMYRCVAYYALENGIDLDDEEALKSMLSTIKIQLTNTDVFINNVKVTDQIRENKISMGASVVSKHLLVRKELVKRQQEMAKNLGFIMDGRDIGTVVLKNAKIKIFLTATSSARAERRYKENLRKGIVSDYNQLVKEIEQRDYNDCNRVNSPLRQAEDAVLVDTSNLSIEEVVSKICKIIDEKR